MGLTDAIPFLDGITNLASTAMQIRANKKADERANQWANEAQNRANAENIKFWNLQNDYNSPNGQMSRLRQAGLNPNLVYGNGATAQGSSIAPSKAAETRSTSNAGPFSQIASTIGQSLQNDNLRTQNTVLMQEAALKAAQTATEGTKNARSQFDLKLAQDLRATSMEAAKINLERLSHITETARTKSIVSSNDAHVSNYTRDARVDKIVLDAKLAASHLRGQELKNALLGYEKMLNDFHVGQKSPAVKAGLTILQQLLKTRKE